MTRGRVGKLTPFSRVVIDLEILTNTQRLASARWSDNGENMMILKIKASKQCHSDGPFGLKCSWCLF